MINENAMQDFIAEQERASLDKGESQEDWLARLKQYLHELRDQVAMVEQEVKG